MSCYICIIKRNPAQLQRGASVLQSCPSFCSKPRVPMRNPFTEGETKCLAGRTLLSSQGHVSSSHLPKGSGQNTLGRATANTQMFKAVRRASTEIICYSPCHASFLGQPTYVDWPIGNYKSQPNSR